MRSNFRSVLEWRNSGYPLKTSSDVACKMYDAALTQLYGWYNDPNLGGFEGTLKEMRMADPNFLLGKALSINLCLGRRFSSRNAALKTQVEELLEMAKKQADLSNIEKLHVEAIEYWTEGRLLDARSTWDDILEAYPQDRMALRLVFDTDFYIGAEQHRYDTMRRAISADHSDPLGGYLYGYYGFSLCETNNYVDGEKAARKGLEIMGGKDAWATHALSHTLEMRSHNAEGIASLLKNEDKWVVNGALTCHNYWHLCLFHLGMNDIEAAIEVYDSEVVKRLDPLNTISIGDAASFLYRIKMLGGKVEDRWKDLFATCESRFEDHSHFLQDIHMFLTCALANNQPTTDLMKNLLEEYRDGDHERYKTKGPLLKALYDVIEDYNNEHFSAVVDKLFPLQNQIVDIGGSQAQRDIFSLMLITAALNSDRPKDHKLAKLLLNDRKESFGESPLLESLMERCVLLHDS